MQPDDAYRVYESTWRNMDRENNLVNQRIGWALTLTGGFLTAEAFLLGRVIEIIERGGLFGEYIQVALVACALLSGLAAIICWSVSRGVSAAFAQIRYLETVYDATEEHLRKMQLPRPFGGQIEKMQGANAAKIFPPAMTALWTVFAAVQAGYAVFLR